MIQLLGIWTDPMARAKIRAKIEWLITQGFSIGFFIESHKGPFRLYSFTL